MPTFLNVKSAFTIQSSVVIILCLAIFNTYGQAVLVKDIHTGGSFTGSDPDEMVELNNILYFAANDGASHQRNELSLGSLEKCASQHRL